MTYRRQIFTITLLAALLAAVCLAYAYFIEPRRLVVNQYELKIKGWNPAFDGLRVALVSDIHAGSNGIDEAKLHEIVSRTNEQGVDAIFLLGDYISRRPADHSQLRVDPAVVAENLKGLQANYGVFAVLGNHELMLLNFLGYYGSRMHSRTVSCDPLPGGEASAYR